MISRFRSLRVIRGDLCVIETTKLEPKYRCGHSVGVSSLVSSFTLGDQVRPFLTINHSTP